MHPSVNRLPSPTAADIHIVALPKGRERYVFLYDEAHREEIIQVIVKYATDPNLGLTLLDADILECRIRLIA